mmetsp:Transcript_50344/g.118234  ORF Transcript_50344/g.118234 Transcript_50344/m.118234 type:complete len:237 (-) Transcript_50344:46-756(-)
MERAARSSVWERTCRPWPRRISRTISRDALRVWSCWSRRRLRIHSGKSEGGDDTPCGQLRILSIPDWSSRSRRLLTMFSTHASDDGAARELAGTGVVRWSPPNKASVMLLSPAARCRVSAEATSPSGSPPLSFSSCPTARNKLSSRSESRKPTRCALSDDEATRARPNAPDCRLARVCVDRFRLSLVGISSPSLLSLVSPPDHHRRVVGSRPPCTTWPASSGGGGLSSRDRDLEVG